jgi:ribonuclease-3
MNNSTSYQALLKKLDYQFKDLELLQLALSHRSVGSKNNERLEFLGDAVLNYVIGHELFARFPKAREGELSRLRASLVKGELLAKIGKELELGDLLNLGPGELKSGGFRRSSILADAVEAIIGAVEQDAGFEAARKLIYHLYRERLQNIDINQQLKDPKTQLQEYLQGRGQGLPRYEVVNVDGADHNQQFTVECHVEILNKSVSAVGSSRRKAEQKAAKQTLEQLQKS